MEKNIKKLILSALINAAFIGYDKDDDDSQEMIEDLASETTKKVLKEMDNLTKTKG